MSTKTHSTSKTSVISSTISPWSNNKKMKELHKEFSKLNSGLSNPQKFTQKVKNLGYNPTDEIQKVLNDPNPKFKNIIKTFENSKNQLTKKDFQQNSEVTIQDTQEKTIQKPEFLNTKK